MTGVLAFAAGGGCGVLSSVLLWRRLRRRFAVDHLREAVEGHASALSDMTTEYRAQYRHLQREANEARKGLEQFSATAGNLVKLQGQSQVRMDQLSDDFDALEKRLATQVSTLSTQLIDMKEQSPGPETVAAIQRLQEEVEGMKTYIIDAARQAAARPAVAPVSPLPPESELNWIRQQFLARRGASLPMPMRPQPVAEQIEDNGGI